MKIRLALLATAVVVSLVAIQAPSEGDDQKDARVRPTAQVAGSMPDVEGAVADVTAAAAEYVHSVEVHEVEVAVYEIGTQAASYIEAIQAQEAAAARAVVARPVSTTGSTSGGHSDAWWHGVSICEQGGRNDPYFGYFSFMDGSQGGRPWADQVAAGNALLAAVGHEVGPWAASCVAAGYAASPSG